MSTISHKFRLFYFDLNRFFEMTVKKTLSSSMIWKSFQWFLHANVRFKIIFLRVNIVFGDVIKLLVQYRTWYPNTNRPITIQICAYDFFEISLEKYIFFVSTFAQFIFDFPRVDIAFGNGNMLPARVTLRMSKKEWEIIIQRCAYDFFKFCLKNIFFSFWQFIKSNVQYLVS